MLEGKEHVLIRRMISLLLFFMFACVVCCLMLFNYEICRFLILIWLSIIWRGTHTVDKSLCLFCCCYTDESLIFDLRSCYYQECLAES